jgi:hypothetical protein
MHRASIVGVGYDVVYGVLGDIQHAGGRREPMRQGKLPHHHRTRLASGRDPGAIR